MSCWLRVLEIRLRDFSAIKVLIMCRANSINSASFVSFAIQWRRDSR